MNRLVNVRIILALALASLFVLAGAKTILANEDAIPVIVARETYLLLDRRLISSSDNAELKVGVVKKHPANPLFAEDKPWEVRFDNLYVNIFYDGEEEIFKCWYSPFIQDVEDKPPMEKWDEVSYPQALKKLEGDAKRRMGICYAISGDGVRWTKPNLGLVEFEGSKTNNIVYLDPHGAGIFKDLTETDENRRYKMITGAQPHGTLSSAFSRDGLQWSPLQKIARVRGDTHNNAFWNPVQKNYVAISREFSDGMRTVVRLESDDFVHWSEPEEVLRGSKTAQTYAMPVLFRHGIFLGFIAVFHTQTDRVTTELAWSPDSLTWHRIDEGNPLIHLAEKRGQYDWGCAYTAASPVIMPNGEVRIYYGASNGKHTSWRDGFLALATLRRDGWAGYEPEDDSKSGAVETQAIRCSGETLSLAADAELGSIGVTLKDVDGEILGEGVLLKGDESYAAVEWKNGFELSAHKGQLVQLEFTINHAKLYAFKFDQPQPNKTDAVNAAKVP